MWPIPGSSKRHRSQGSSGRAREATATRSDCQEDRESATSPGTPDDQRRSTRLRMIRMSMVQTHTPKPHNRGRRHPNQTQTPDPPRHRAGGSKLWRAGGGVAVLQSLPTKAIDPELVAGLQVHRRSGLEGIHGRPAAPSLCVVWVCTYVYVCVRACVCGLFAVLLLLILLWGGVCEVSCSCKNSRFAI